jgi:hypothetical protein
MTLLYLALIYINSFGLNWLEHFQPVFKQSYSVSDISGNSNFGNSIIYILEEPTDEEDVGIGNSIAVPIVMYRNGKFEEPPYCCDFETKNNCDKADKLLSPFVQPCSVLFPIIKKKKKEGLLVQKTVEYGWECTRSSGLVHYANKRIILTNNPSIGTNNTIELKPNDRPVLPNRKNVVEGGYFKDEFIGMVDIDGDNNLELIYNCLEYEGHYFVIYSKRNNKWKKIYEGGGDGL